MLILQQLPLINKKTSPKRLVFLLAVL